MDLDPTDHAIVEVLQLDGRITNAELAERVKLSPSACLRRVRALEQRGVIDRYVALVNPESVNRSTSVFVQISLTSQQERQLDAFEAAILRCPDVMSCHLMSGEADYLLHLVCADVSHYEHIHRTQLALLPGVARLQSSFAMRRICDRTDYRLGSTPTARTVRSGDS